MRKQVVGVEILSVRKMLKTYKAEVKDINDVKDDIRIIKFVLDMSEFEFFPGAFVMLWKDNHLDENGNKVKRAYSIASSNKNKDYLEICFKIEDMGEFSKKVEAMKIGDKVNIMGPFNSNFVLKDSHDPVFVAAGTGIAPIMSMIRSNDKLETTLIYGIKTPKDYLYRDELEMKKNIKKVICVSREESEFFKGRIDKKVLKKNLTDISKDVFVCGPSKMVENTVKNLKMVGFSKMIVERWG